MTKRDDDLVLTDEQAQVVESAGGKDSVMIRAYAGAAKTTTLVLASRRIRVPALSLAFNRSIAKELGGRMGPNFKVQTLNSLGYGAWARARPGMSMQDPDGRKLGKLVSDIDREWKTKLLSDDWMLARQLATAAMQAGLSPENEGDPMVQDTPEEWKALADGLWIPEGSFEQLQSVAWEALRRSIELSKMGIMSFDDQVYCPTILGGHFPQYPVLMVDEAQDLSPLNHRMIKLSNRPDGRLIVVGDPKQAIYQFRGADSQSMDRLASFRDRWAEPMLRTTFRCPKIVVERQQGHAPGFRAAPANRQGHFEKLAGSWEEAGELKGGWGFRTLRKVADREGCESIVVICRNNAPLMGLAMKLIRAGVGPYFLGRDIGKGLVSLSRKISPEDGEPIARFAVALQEWYDREAELATANGQEEKIASLTDRRECLRAIVDTGVGSAGELRSVIEKIFAKEGGDVTLSTVHKAKGLEFDLVVHLDPWRIPSKFARDQREAGDPTQWNQELNLRYVAETRARKVLLNADLDGWNPNE